MSEYRSCAFEELISLGVLQINDGYRAKNDELGGNGLIFLRAGHVTDTHIDFSGVERFHSELTNKVSSKLAKPDDVIVTTKGNSTGRISWVTKEMPAFVYSPHLSYWRSLKPDVLHPGYLRYWAYSQEFKAQLNGLKVSTDMAPYLSLSDQKRLRISIPPIELQSEIAHILGTLDDKIDLNRRMNATLEETARAIFKSWFVDFDPVRAKAEGRDPVGMDAETAALFPDSFEESELGLIPRGWRVGSISDHCRVARGASPRPINDYMNGSVPWVKIADATAANGPFIFETKEKVKFEGVSKSVLLTPGTLILSNSATTGIPVFLELEGCIHDGWLYFQNLHTISQNYLYYLLLTISDHLTSIADGTVQRNLNTALVGSQRFVVPDARLLSQFDELTVPLLEKVKQSGHESRTLAETRDALLPKLVSGEIRVGD